MGQRLDFKEKDTLKSTIQAAGDADAPKPSKRFPQPLWLSTRALNPASARCSQSIQDALNQAQQATGSGMPSSHGAKTAVDLKGRRSTFRRDLRLDHGQLPGSIAGSRCNVQSCSIRQFITQSQREHGRRDGAVILESGSSCSRIGRASRHTQIVPLPPLRTSYVAKLTSISTSDSVEQRGHGAVPLGSLKLVPELVQATEWCRAKHEVEQLEREKLEV